MSDWVDGEGITIRLVGMIDNIKDAPVFQNRAFSLRMLLLPMGLGKSLIWLVCAEHSVLPATDRLKTIVESKYDTHGAPSSPPVR